MNIWTDSSENTSECHQLLLLSSSLPPHHWYLSSDIFNDHFVCLRLRIFRWKGTMTERKRTTMKVTERTRSHSARIWHHHPVPSTTAATRLTTRRMHLWVRTASSDYYITMATNPVSSNTLKAHLVRTHTGTLRLTTACFPLIVSFCTTWFFLLYILGNSWIL